MLNVSNGYRTAILGSQSFAEIFAGGSILIFQSSRPQLPDQPYNPANIIGKVNRTGFDGGLNFEQNGPYIESPTAQAWELDVSETGTAAWFRIVGENDTNQISATDARIDGDVGTVTGLGELLLQSQSLEAGTAIPIDSFLFTIAPFLG